MGKDDLFDDTCGGCVHYMERKGQQSGSCYRYPPTPLPISMQAQSRVVTPDDGAAAMTGNVAVGAMYPPVNRQTIACGEFEQDDATVDNN